MIISQLPELFVQRERALLGPRFDAMFSYPGQGAVRSRIGNPAATPTTMREPFMRRNPVPAPRLRCWMCTQVCGWQTCAPRRAARAA